MLSIKCSTDEKLNEMTQFNISYKKKEKDSRTAFYLKDPNGYSKAARSAALLYPLGSTRAYARGARLYIDARQ